LLLFIDHHNQIAQFDKALLNKAVEQSIKDKEFLNSSLNLLKNAKFPMFRTK
jgi:hypothetical protein